MSEIEQELPEANEAEQTKTDAEHVRKMNPAKSLAFGLMFAVGTAFGTTQNVDAQGIFSTRMEMSQHHSQHSVNAYSIQVNKILNTYASGRSRLSYQDAYHQIRDVFTIARLEVRNSNLQPQVKANELHNMDRALKDAMEQLKHYDAMKNFPMTERRR